MLLGTTSSYKVFATGIPVKNKLGSAVRIVRSAKGMSLSALASQSRIGIPFLSLIESGKRSPSIEVLERISTALDIPSETLMVFAAPEGVSVRTSNERANSLMASVQKLVDAEAHLCARLKEKVHTDETKSTNSRRNSKRIKNIS